MMRLSNGNNTLAEVQKDFDDAAAFLGGNAEQWLKKSHFDLIAIILSSSKYMTKIKIDISLIEVAEAEVYKFGAEVNVFTLKLL